MFLKGFFAIFVLVFFSGCSLHTMHLAKKADRKMPYIGAAYEGHVPSEVQQQAAMGVIERLLGPEYSAYFQVKIIPAPDERDFFAVDSDGTKIILSGNNALSATRGLKWYLNEVCNSSITWRGNNLQLSLPLSVDFEPHQAYSPLQYRYIFNNCIYGYSFAFWQWEEWEHMLDILAYNGINMPAMLLGQEKIWQLTYNELGLSNEDLDTFFAGPAWYPWQWMGNLNGWGGPLPQSIIDKQALLQKKILNRARELGMKPVLPGFSGHIPPALVEKYPDLQYHTMDWWGFDDTYTLDWQDPLFKKISEIFMNHQRQVYGTDHYYNVDPFNEMTPPRSDKAYLANMSRTIFESIDRNDPKGVWVFMTWFAKSETDPFWNRERTQWFLDSVPNDRMLAIELWGENRQFTGWNWQDGWYGKPWIWSILQNFGDRVDIYGSLRNIHANYYEMLQSPDRGNPVGMGIMTEGLGYNPIVYELVLDMMWGEALNDLDTWKQSYLRKRYGQIHPSVDKSWEILFQSRYDQMTLVDITPLLYPPRLVSSLEIDRDIVEAWQHMLAAAEELGHIPAYQFDLINLGREAMGNFALYETIALQEAIDRRDLEAFDQASRNMLQYIKDFDALLSTNTHFLLGKWIEDARALASNREERKLMEWNAKRQITDWGGLIGRYAIKEWGGFFTDSALPVWKYYLIRRRNAMLNFEEIHAGTLFHECDNRMKAWALQHSSLSSTPQGCAVEISQKMWDKYGQRMLDYEKLSGTWQLRQQENVPGIAVHKKVTASGVEHDAYPEYAVNGKLTGKYWGAPSPGWLMIDLGRQQTVAAFHIFPYYLDERYYQYNIEISVDGANWMQVVDMSSNKKLATPQGHYHPFTAGYSFRYVRLNMIRNSVNNSVHVVEFKVLSPQDEEKLFSLKETP